MGWPAAGAPLTGITADPAGLLWLSIAVAASEWVPGMDPQAEPETYFDTRVLAIDPTRRTIVGGVQLDPLCMPVERNLISCVDELGEMVRVMALELGPSQRAGR